MLPDDRRLHRHAHRQSLIHEGIKASSDLANVYQIGNLESFLEDILVQSSEGDASDLVLQNKLHKISIKAKLNSRKLIRAFV